MSLFGNSSTQGTTGGGLFGSNSNQANNASSLFGSSTTQANNTGGGIFGSSTAQASKPAGGLFGASTAQPTTGTSGGLFASNTNQASSSGGLFGASTTQNQSGAGSGLFGSTTNQGTAGNTTGGGLFGSSTTQNTNTGGGGLFGASTNQNQNQNQNNSGTSLFGGAQPTAGSNTQQNANNSMFGGSLFGAPNTQAQASTGFGAQSQQTQQQQPGQLNTSVFNAPTVSVSGHNLTSAQLQYLQMNQLSTVPNEKKISQQLMTVAMKWMAQTPENTPVMTTLKTYLYNAVPKEYAPFHYPDPRRGEDERSWEEALSQKPEVPRIDGKEVANIAFVPTLCKGFNELGERVRIQATTIERMRERLHEMNNSLSAVMDAHQQRITVKIAQAKRQHEILSQRCLKLAVKVQVLRNRGYALDAAEENLRKTLMGLEKQVLDPTFVGREDEIWARMVVLRERARWLEEEGKRVAAETSDQSTQSAESTTNGVPEHVLAKTRKILKDYDGQLQHLNRELEEVKKEYSEWEASQIHRS